MSDVARAIEADNLLKNLGKPVDLQNDANILAQQFSDFGEYLLPSPYAIAILGNLILISASGDFNLVVPEGGFKYLSYSKFRPSIVQVAHKGWFAFDCANTKMTQISQLSNGIQGVVKTALRLVLAGSIMDIKHTVPSELKRVKEIAETCTKYAQDAEKGFMDVMDIVSELLQVCVATQGVTEEEDKKVETAIKIHEFEKKQTQDFKKVVQASYDKAVKQVDEDEKNYKDAVKNMPSTGQIIGAALGDAFINLTKDALSMGAAYYSMKAGGGGYPNTMDSQNKNEYFPNTSSSNGQTEQEQKEQRAKNDALFNCFRVSQMMPQQIDALHSLATGGENGQPLWDRMKNKNDDANLAKGFLVGVKKDVQGIVPQLPLITTVEQLCTDGINLADELSKAAENVSDTPDFKEKVKDIQDKAAALQQSKVAYEAMKAKTTVSNPLDQSAYNTNKAKSAMLQQAAQNKSTSNIAGSLIENAHAKVEIAQAQLKIAKEDEQRKYENLKEQNEKLTKILVEMDQLHVKHTDFVKIRKILMQGIDALGKLRQQWRYLLEFFHQISTLVKCVMEVSVKNFVAQAESGIQQAGDPDAVKFGGFSLSKTFKDSIIIRAVETSKAAYIVNNLSSMYVQVSQKSLMSRITDLDTMLTLDPSDDSDVAIIKQKKAQLFKNCQNTQTEIRNAAKNYSDQMAAGINKRVAEMQEATKNLPKIEDSKAVKIKESVQKGVVQNPEGSVDDLLPV